MQVEQDSTAFPKVLVSVEQRQSFYSSHNGQQSTRRSFERLSTLNHLYGMVEIERLGHRMVGWILYGNLGHRVLEHRDELGPRIARDEMK